MRLAVVSAWLAMPVSRSGKPPRRPPKLASLRRAAVETAKAAAHPAALKAEHDAREAEYTQGIENKPLWKLNVRPAPSPRVIVLWLWSVYFNVSGLGSWFPAKMEVRAARSSIRAASGGRSMFSFKPPFDCQAIFVSPHADLADPATRMDAPGNLLYAATAS